MMIGIILFVVIIVCVFVRVYMAQGCFFKPVFREDVRRYAQGLGMSDDETVKFIRDNRDMLRERRVDEPWTKKQEVYN